MDVSEPMTGEDGEAWPKEEVPVGLAVSEAGAINPVSRTDPWCHCSPRGDDSGIVDECRHCHYMNNYQRKVEILNHEVRGLTRNLFVLGNMIEDLTRRVGTVESKGRVPTSILRAAMQDLGKTTEPVDDPRGYIQKTVEEALRP